MPSASRSWQALTPSLSTWILEAIESMGFQKMTPVQASAIPLSIGNHDVVVEAVTGSGKTLSYLIPTIERILRLDEVTKKHHIAAIIISPTRELATQIHHVLTSLLSFHGPSAAAMKPPEQENASIDEPEVNASSTDQEPTQPPYPPSTPRIVPQLLVGGSTSPTEDLRYFLKQSPNLLIATPGRLLEILSSPHVKYPRDSFEVLILDEADRLLDLGFKADLQKILGRLPKQRRTGLFSASVSEALDQIIRVGLRNPVKISVKVKSTTGDNDQRTPTRRVTANMMRVFTLTSDSLQMTYLTMPASHRIVATKKLIHSLDPLPAKSIIYLSTCAGVDYYQHLLSHVFSSRNRPIAIIPLHGKHPPNVRQRNFSNFANSVKPSVLLTTDVAARGLDIPQVDLVLQMDPPNDPKVFLHRCGRAGRAGRKGLSVIFLQPGREEDYIQFLEVRKTPIIPLEDPSITVSEEEANAFTRDMRELLKKDRALHDKGQRAFVSWVQAYSKHQAASIFRIADLDWTELGNAWALLKLPKMPELKKWDGDRGLGVNLDWANYAYKDKNREKQRLETLKDVEDGKFVQEAKPARKKDIQSWSQKFEAREDRTRRREQRHAKRKREVLDKMSADELVKQRELDQMIQEVKRRRLLEEDDSFEGFGN